ncbi:MAG: 6-carboxytetrahydropterin synthase [Bacteroidia bacterium]
MSEPKKRTLYITRKAHFNAAHRLYNPAWSDEENELQFGKCANKNYHGHNFNLFVTLKGTAEENTGMVMDLRKLKETIEDSVISRLDHKNLNLDVDFMQGKIASIENLVIEIWKLLEQQVIHGKLHCVKITETDNHFVEYYGE